MVISLLAIYTIRGSRILTGLLYCECGKKCTSQTHRYARERANGTTWYWENASYRCGSYRTPKKGLCNKLPFRAETLEKLVIADAKRFLVETDIIKLSQSNEMDIQAKIDMLNNGLCQLKQEKAKKEKERQKFKDEFGKVILGESQASQSLLMELIQVKEEELVAIDKRIKETEGRIDELQLTIETQKSGIDELRNWRERFDSQDTMEKKTMLINLIDKIVLNDGFVEVAYKVPIDNYIEQQYCAVDDAENANFEQFAFLSSPEFVQTLGCERTTPTPT